MVGQQICKRGSMCSFNCDIALFGGLWFLRQWCNRLSIDVEFLRVSGKVHDQLVYFLITFVIFRPQVFKLYVDVQTIYGPTAC